MWKGSAFEINEMWLWERESQSQRDFLRVSGKRKRSTGYEGRRVNEFRQIEKKSLNLFNSKKKCSTTLCLAGGGISGYRIYKIVQRTIFGKEKIGNLCDGHYNLSHRKVVRKIMNLFVGLKELFQFSWLVLYNFWEEIRELKNLWVF